jgi:hypothetical protein
MLNDAKAADGASRAPAPAAMSGAAASTSRRAKAVSGCVDTAPDAETVRREVDMMSESADLLAQGLVRLEPMHWAGANASMQGAYAASAAAATRKVTCIDASCCCARSRKKRLQLMDGGQNA